MKDLFSNQTRNPTPFVPERIREAREAKAYSSEEFAELLGVTRQALAQYEGGQIAPRPEIMSKIIGETGQPVSFFTTHKREVPPNMGVPFWRSLKRTDTVYRNRTVRRLEWALEITRYIERFVNLPKVNLPAVEFDVEWPEDRWVDAVERAAMEVRKAWSLGAEPIEHFERHIEANGIVLVQDEVLTDDMDAVSRWQAGRPFILYAKETISAVRIKYNLAHELGHVVLHAGVEVNSKNLPLIEKQADRFAGALLLPQATFAREALRTSLNHFLFLKNRWKVSIAAMVYRARDLGILSENQYRYIWRQMNAQNIRRKEPLDGIVPTPQPNLLREALQMLLDNGVQSTTDIQEALALNSDDIAALTSVETTIFKSPLVQFDLSKRTANEISYKARG